ncbi:MAG: flagellar export chaperone FliS [Pontiellaceae bacterium]|nr:flagellar export chaperone FliS [Pontiellaceae bacterium]MBN2784091.1 flagellar export chaperone FliS [Pontiellaceae bacterium]
MTEINPYQKSAVTTATAMELVLMVYDECIRTLDLAEEAFSIEGPDSIQAIGKQIIHAQETITELSLSLDMERGGDIAMNLYRVYDFMISHLSKANAKKELKPIQEVREMMVDLREAWQQVSGQEAMMQDENNNPSPPGNSGGRFRLAG